jgi:hypothetical protein
MVETIALTIFAEVREARIEPVLADLMPYYEKDEARHVGLGTQYLPQIMRKMTRWEGAKTTAFQLRLVFWTLAGLKAMEKDLATLGIVARDMGDRGRKKQIAAFQELWSSLGTEPPGDFFVDRGIMSIKEVLFPLPENLGNRRAQIQAAIRTWRNWKKPEANAADLAQIDAEPKKSALA